MQAVLARPLEREEDIVPCLLRQERLARPGLNRPVRDRKTDPVEARAGDLGEVMLGLKAT